jgi:phage shock protein A
VRLKDIKLRQGTLKAKAKANRDGTMTAKTSAFNEFERMSSRIDATEVEAGLDDELAGRSTARIAAERQLDQMASDSAVDDALAELKRKLGK